MTSTSKPTAKCSDINTSWGSSVFVPLVPCRTKWTGRKATSRASAGNQEQRWSQINCQEGRWAKGLSCGEDRKQDNGRLVLEIIPEVYVLNSCRISVTHRARLKWNETVQRRKRTPLPWNVSVEALPSNLSVLPLLQNPLWIITSRLLAGMALSLSLWPPQKATEA